MVVNLLVMVALTVILCIPMKKNLPSRNVYVKVHCLLNTLRVQYTCTVTDIIFFDILIFQSCATKPCISATIESNLIEDIVA